MNGQLSYVLGRLDASRGRWQSVARESGVPYETLKKLAQRKVKNPRIETVEKLSRYFLGAAPEVATCE